MMSEFHDPKIESLFSDARRDLEGDAITERVMAGTRKRLLGTAAAGGAAALALLLIGWHLFALPLLDFAVLISQFLTNPLIDLGGGWMALAFMPINNLASISVLLVKGLLMAWKKLTGATLVR